MHCFGRQDKFSVLEITSLKHGLYLDSLHRQRVLVTPDSACNKQLLAVKTQMSELDARSKVGKNNIYGIMMDKMNAHTHIHTSI